MKIEVDDVLYWYDNQDLSIDVIDYHNDNDGKMIYKLVDVQQDEIP